jgi:guanylate kinase
MAGILFLISAPSGSGKSTLVNQLRSLVDGLDFSISYTTRASRGSEQDGREYHFISREQFAAMVERGEFLEHAQVFGNFYGTPRASLTMAAEHGRDLLLDIDVQGAEQVRQKVPDAVSIFVLPPNPEVLEMRLRNRSRAEGTVAEDVIERRLAKARTEIENYRQYRYILVNNILDKAVEELTAIVKCERLKRGAEENGSAQGDLQHLADIAERCRQGNVSGLEDVLRSFGLGAQMRLPNQQLFEHGGE